MCCSSFNRISQTPREFKSHPSNTTLKHRYVLQMSKMYARHWKRWKVSCLTDVRFVWTWQPQDAEEEEGEVVVIVCAVRVLVRSLEMVDTSDFKCCPMCLLCFFFFVFSPFETHIKKKIKSYIKRKKLRLPCWFCHGQTSTSTS